MKIGEDVVIIATGRAGKIVAVDKHPHPDKAREVHLQAHAIPSDESDAGRAASSQAREKFVADGLAALDQMEWYSVQFTEQNEKGKLNREDWFTASELKVA